MVTLAVRITTKTDKNLMSLSKLNIAIFASGGGSNAERLIIESQLKDLNYQVKLVMTNNANAGVINICHRLATPCFYWKNSEIENHTNLISFLKKNNIEMVVLAGYLRKISPELIEAFQDKIINLHPALLPKFGGKGMYGHHVHEAVLAAKETETGITFHYVNANYDEGNIIAQFKCRLTEKDTLQTIQKKIQELEHKNFYQVIDNIGSEIKNIKQIDTKLE